MKQNIKLLKFNVNPPDTMQLHSLMAYNQLSDLANQEPCHTPFLVQFQILSSPSHKSLQGIPYLYLFD